MPGIMLCAGFKVVIKTDGIYSLAGEGDDKLYIIYRLRAGVKVGAGKIEFSRLGNQRVPF